MIAFEEAMLSAIRRHGMVADGQTVVVAVSGGPDSTALLHALFVLRDRLGISIVAAHMDHGIRGAESAADADLVAGLCRSLGVEAVIECRDIPAIAKARRLPLAVAAREERHAFLRRIAQEFCQPVSQRIAIGHTSDDRVETVLMNIIRGTGIDGLYAMPAVQLPVVRPLLGFARSETAAYCAEVGLQPAVDSSNTDPKYTRNRVRLELLPLLEEYYNTGVRGAFLRLAEVAEEDAIVLDEQATSLFHSAVTSRGKLDINLSRSTLQSAPLALTRRAIRLAINEVRNDLADIGFDEIERIVASVNGSLTTELTLPNSRLGSVHVRVTSDTLRLWVPAVGTSRSGWRQIVEIPCVVQIPGSALTVTVDAQPARTAVNAPASDAWTCVFRKSSLTDRLILRTWQPGDRIRVGGPAGTKKLQDLYTDCKVRGAARLSAPVVTLTDEPETIMAVLGLRAGELALTSAELRTIVESSPDELLVRVTFDAVL